MSAIPTPPAAHPRAALVVALSANAVLAALLLLAIWAWRTHWTPAAAARRAPAPAAATPATPAVAPSGPALAPVAISPQRLQRIGVTTAVVERRPLMDDLRLVGNVAVDERREATVQTRFAGWIRQVFVNTNYQHVRAGEPLFTIYSPELVTTEREYLLARQNAALLASSPVPGVAAGARALLAATLERLRQWALPEREIQRLETSGQVRQYLEVDSPATGFVTERNALPNLYVQPSTRLYAITDFSKVWVYAQAYQNDLGRLAVGDPATLTVDAYPGRSFHGRVDFIYPDVNPATRTARVRLAFANPKLLLKPGMFVNVDLKIAMGPQIAVPASAVLQSGEHQVAFLDRGDGTLTPRMVTLGAAVGNRYVVLRGLRPGERIVTSATFLIDSESQLQAALGDFAPAARAAPAGRAAGAPAARFTLTLATQPSPPRPGSDRFQARLSDAHGRGVAGAQVEVRLDLPAMPAMGMAAMQARYELTDEGGGNYAAQGPIPSAGTWQATVVARRNGAIIASRELQLSVGGGTR